MAEPVTSSAPAAAPAQAATETEQYKQAPAVTESSASVSEKTTVADPTPATQHGLDTRIPEQNVLAQQLGSGPQSELHPNTEKRT